MRLYGGNQSSSSRRVTLTAAQLGLELPLEPIDLRQPEQRAKLGDLNPNNKIPVLDDGDFRLWESHAIIQYLCDRTPGQTLYPTGARERAEVHRWLYWISAHVAPPAGGLGWERLWKKIATGGEPDPAMCAYHERIFAQFAKVADDHLATTPWLANETMSLADLSLAATLMYAKPAKLPIDGHRHLHALLGRIHDLDAWRRTDPPMAWA